MLPNLTWIVAAYVVVRLLALIAKQVPRAGAALPVRVTLCVAAVAAIAITVAATYATTVMSAPKLNEEPTQNPLWRAF